MPRNQVKFGFIENERKRKSCFNKRAQGLVKSTQELSILCGIDCCLIAINPSDGQQVVWPSVPEDFEKVLSRYQNLPNTQKGLNSLNQESFLKKLHSKLQNQRMGEKRQKEVSDLLFKCLIGLEKVDRFGLKDIVDMSKVLDAKLKDIETRQKSLLDHQDPNQGSTDEEIIVVGPNSPPGSDGKGKGKEVMMTALPFDLNKVKTELDDPDIADTWWEDPNKVQPDVINNNRNGDGAGPSSHS